MTCADLFLDYDLPNELVAQTGVEPRDASRLLVVDRKRHALTDRVFSDLPELLTPGDLIIINDSKVFPARLSLRRRTGGRVEIVLLERKFATTWSAMVRPLGRLRTGEDLELLAKDGSPTGRSVRLTGRDGSIGLVDVPEDSTLEDHGRLPLPPYIEDDLADGSRYQTVYSDEAGSAAAPTAGLHFTTRLLERCRERDVDIKRLTLHVGVDTFRPLAGDDPEDHKMHSEWFSVPEETWTAVQSARRDGRRIVGVGTTVTRVLETLAAPDWPDGRLTGRTSKYIKPPYEFQVVGGLITNFHLPRTTLLLLVGAFAEPSLLRSAYEHAIRERYRFYSLGDAMLIV